MAFDPATKAFAPWRKGEKTRLVDFGGVKGIPGLLEVMAFMQARHPNFQQGRAPPPSAYPCTASCLQAAGWELGTDLGGSGQQGDAAANLYAAPFDWRVPSAAQDQFFDDTKVSVAAPAAAAAALAARLHGSGPAAPPARLSPRRPSSSTPLRRTARRSSCGRSRSCAVRRLERWKADDSAVA